MTTAKQTLGLRTESNRYALIALIGNPNTGKTTLFNALTGLNYKVANYPGVTVERREGYFQLPGVGLVRLLDLPGIYTLATFTPEEEVAVQVLSGELEERPDLILVVADAPHLRRNLFLLTQLLELGRPVVVALNMVDEAEHKGIKLDLEKLEQKLSVPVVPIVARSRRGLEALKQTLASSLNHPTDARPEAEKVPQIEVVPEVTRAARKLQEKLKHDKTAISFVEALRILIDQGGCLEKRLLTRRPELEPLLSQLRREITPDGEVASYEARRRQQFCRRLAEEVIHHTKPQHRWSDLLEQIAGHPFWGTLLFFAVMFAVFQAVFSWATPLMDAIDALFGGLAAAIHERLPPGPLTSLLADGIVSGVGSVLVFLPQIALLSLLILLLEESGYMARAAFLADRLMRMAGLSGYSFIPMLASFACAVPGIMAARIVPEPRDRLATILAIPFITCSARLPVYTLLIAAFVPPVSLGIVNLQGLVLFGLYLIGILGAIFTAWLLKKTLLRAPLSAFVLELPPFRLPTLRTVFLRLWERVSAFLYRAGTVIFTVAVVIWALSYFPRPQALIERFETQKREILKTFPPKVAERRVRELENRKEAALLEQSYLGQVGKTIEPLFRPLGWDWKVSAAVLASFPAREVVIAVLGTLYAVGSEAEEQSLVGRLRSARWPDGRSVFTLPMVFGLLLFYALCLQCVATLATIYRETGSLKWPIFAWCSMTTLGYLSALTVYQVGSRFGLDGFASRQVQTSPALPRSLNPETLFAGGQLQTFLALAIVFGMVILMLFRWWRRRSVCACEASVCPKSRHAPQNGFRNASR